MDGDDRPIFSHLKIPVSRVQLSLRTFNAEEPLPFDRKIQISVSSFNSPLSKIDPVALHIGNQIGTIPREERIGLCIFTDVRSEPLQISLKACGICVREIVCEYIQGFGSGA